MTSPARVFLALLLVLVAVSASWAQPAPKADAAPTKADLTEAKPEPTNIESASLEMRSTDKETIAIFDKNVIVTGTNLKITCDHLEVIASARGDLKATIPTLDKFKSLIAVGHVHIVQGDRDVTCGRAEVFPREEKIILKEEPVVIDKSGPYVFTGTEIILLRGERQLFGKDIKFSGPPVRDLGFDKNKPMKEPAPAPSKTPPSTP